MLRRFLLPVLLAAAPAGAELLGVRVTGQAQPNCWSIGDVVEGVTRGLKTDREKALALYRFGMAHFIHFNGPIEERDEYVNDPLKLIGVYGYALCGNNSAAMAALYNRAGMRARTRSLTGHSVPEVWFEDKWNYLDTDMFGYVFLDDGKTLASVDELIRDPDLFLRQKNPPDPFYPFDKKPDMAEVFRRARAHTNYHPYANAHRMNLGLRTGESATLYYRPRDRYLLTTINPPELGILYKDFWVLGPVRRGSLAWCDEKPATYGNGLIEYAPDLRSEAFRLENTLRGAVAQRGRDRPPLGVARAGEKAVVEIEMSSPWVVVGRQNDLTDFDDDTDGATASGLFWRADESDETRILLSADNGQTWKTVWDNRRFRGAVPFQVDLTRYAKGRYAYRVRFEYTDRKGSGRVGLEALRLRTWVALSPMALPRLVAGRNRFEAATAPVRTYYHESRWDKGEGLEGQQLENLLVTDKFPYLRPADAAKPGVLTFRAGPEGPIREIRLSVRMRRTSSRGGPVTLAVDLSEDGGATWKQRERFTEQAGHEMSHMWFNLAVREGVTDGSRTRIRLRSMNGGFEKVIANSDVRAQPAAGSVLRVTHEWSEDGQAKSFTRTFAPDAPSRVYEIDVKAGKLLNQSLRLEAVGAR